MSSFLKTVGMVLILGSAAFFAKPMNVAAQCAAPSFNVAPTFGVGTSPNAIATGDLNGDGNNDLVTANTNSTSLSVLFGNGAGGFGAATNIPVGGLAPTAVAIGDFNSDGKADLVSVNREGGSISILLNNGAGGFAVTTNYDAGSSPRSVAVADLNGDGKLDLAVAAFFSNSIFLFWGDGNGNFLTTTGLTAGTNPIFVAIGDLNADGKSDLAATNYNSGNVSIFLGNGTGGFTAAANFFVSGSPIAVVFADFNTDGKIDLGIGGDEGQVIILLGSGTGSFGSPQFIYTNNRVSHLATADLNNDGKADLVASHWTQGTIGISLGNGNGTFAAPIYYSPGSQPWAVAIADLNHDNKLDIAVVNNGSNNVTVLLGNGNGTFLQSDLYDAGREPRSVVVADFNNDGKDDVAVAGYFHVSAFKNDGTGRLIPSANINLSNAPAALASGDFDRDGNIDLVVANQPTNNVTILRGDGSGGFLLSGNFPAGFAPTSVAVGDFNNDGYDDLAVTNGNSLASILIGNGAGNFGTPISFAVGTNPMFVAVGDLNNDGNFDLIAANTNSSDVSVLLGNGAGNFTPATNFAVGSGPFAVAVGDVNGDGNSDLAVAVESASNVTVLIGNGTGGFSSPTTYTAGIRPNSVVMADFNGDNKLDLAVGTATFSMEVLLNSGTGTFGGATSFPTGGTPASIAVGDFNGDGAIDLAVANRQSDTLAILLNTCGAIPAPVPSLAINDVTLAEGDSGTTNAVFTVSLSLPSNQTISFSYSTKGQTAVSGLDYQLTAGRITFAPGQTLRTIAVPIVGDTMDEFDEGFGIFLLASLNAPIADRQGLGVITDNDAPPGISIADTSLLEGGSGQTPANFTVTLSALSGKPVAVQYGTMNGSAISGSDYVAKSGTVTIPAGSISGTISIQVIGDTTFEPDEFFLVDISADNATLTRPQASGTILNDDAGLQFDLPNYSVSEANPTVTLTVMRVGSTANAVTVDYATSDSAGVNNCNSFNGDASSRCDYETRVGTLHFAAGETSRMLSISIVNDSYAEGSEAFFVTLSNAIGGSVVSPSFATVTITDNESTNGPNPIGQADFFVRQHYIDFLNREPDASGLAFWSNQITECEQPGATCIAEVRRINVSAAFFLSIEFQETGYLVYKFYKAAYGNLPAAPVPVRLEEFLPDTQQIGEGVVVGVGNWQTQLENNKQAFALAFVNRSRFLSAYATSMTPTQFVDALYAKAGVASPPAAERSAAINEFGGAGNTADAAARARALRRVAENSTLGQQELNRAFVLMQYFGYLRRNPYDAPEPGLNFAGYNFWLNKLNEFNGNFVNAEMVKAFITSGEYRQRFGP